MAEEDGDLSDLSDEEKCYSFRYPKCIPRQVRIEKEKQAAKDEAKAKIIGNLTRLLLDKKRKKFTKEKQNKSYNPNISSEKKTLIDNKNSIDLTHYGYAYPDEKNPYIKGGKSKKRKSKKRKSKKTRRHKKMSRYYKTK
jgi:hypothetical protein